MADKHTYKVLRAMDGDRHYAEGDTRELTEADAKHLVELGVLKRVADTKAEPAPKNKADKPAANKAAD